MLRPLLFAAGLTLVLAIGEDDKVINLPGLRFAINYNLYSGYLNAGNNGTWKMHYWLIESKSNPATDPVLVWFQGGPGCSSFGGAFEELGPFYLNFDADTIFENKFSWNSKANVLFLESPIGVGFSYDASAPDYSEANDAQSASQNYAALKDFFARVQPKYANHSFFLSGESYAGVYIPMLAARLTEGINNKDFPNAKFQGAAIGNGFMHVQMLLNALVLWSVYHGRISLDDWDYLKENCHDTSAQKFDVDNYNFFQYLTSTNGMDFVSDNSTCGNIIFNTINVVDPNDAYNYYQDCYDPTFFVYNDSAARRNDHFSPMKQKPRRKRSVVNTDQKVNTASLFNYVSTDNQLAYPCWNWIAVREYANRDDVQLALHIDDAWRKAGINGKQRKWRMCNNPMYNNYTITYPDQQQFFNYVLTNTQNPDFRFLIYNGDVDTVCNFLGDSRFARHVARSNGLNTTSSRMEWYYRNQTAGYVQRFSRAQDNVVIDVLTVKGAGHMVPNDRPAQSLQMINNFLFFDKKSISNYNSTANANPTPGLATFDSGTVSGSGHRRFTLLLAASAILNTLFQ